MALEKLDYYRDLAEDMIEDDEERDKKFVAMDEYDRVKWERPPEFEGVRWFHDMPSTGPHDALHTGARVLSVVQPAPTFFPLDNTPESRARASQIEKVLTWHYWLAARRTVNNLTWDIVFSALKYDTVALQVIYLPWQRKLSGKTKQKWGQSGDFVIIPHNPQTVHVKRNSYGIDSVLVCKKVPLSEIVTTWGELASQLKAYCEENDVDEVVMYDYTDSDCRVVWCEVNDETETTGVSNYSGAPGRVSLDAENIDRSEHGYARAANCYEIIREEHDLPFLPWVVRMGGTNLEDESEYQCRPLLDPVYLSGIYDTVAIARSLRISLAIAHAAFPRTTSVTQDGRTPMIDYTQPGGNVPLKMGESLTVNQPPPIDPSIQEIDNELEMAMASSTVPKLLQDPNVPSGAAFASINTLLKQASTILDPFRLLAENALADAFTQMLYWIIHDKKPLMAWDTTRGIGQDGIVNMGNQIVVNSNEIDPENIYMKVKLVATMAHDDLSRLNAAMLMRQLEISKNRVFENLDFTDPDVILDEWAQEQLEMANVQKELKIIAGEADAEVAKMMSAVQLEAQQAGQQMQQQAAQQQQAQQQAQQAQQNQMMSMGGAPATDQQAMQQSLARSAAGIPPSEQLGSLGIMTASAQKQLGMNPGMGGLPPAMMAPGQTGPAQQGTDQSGNPLP